MSVEKPPCSRPEFEALLAQTFGPDWKSKVLVGPCGSFALRDLPEEAGYLPEPNPSSGAVGLWQLAPPPRWRS